MWCFCYVVFSRENWYYQKAYLKRMAHGTVYYKIDRRIHHHESPSNYIDLIILQGRKEFSFVFNTIDDQVGIGDFFCTYGYSW